MVGMQPGAVMFVSGLGEVLSIADAVQSTGPWLVFSIVAGVALAVVWVLRWRGARTQTP